jgi:hypothetical protein
MKHTETIIIRLRVSSDGYAGSLIDEALDANVVQDALLQFASDRERDFDVLDADCVVEPADAGPGLIAAGAFIDAVVDAIDEAKSSR